jgi:hypothetical protein
MPNITTPARDLEVDLAICEAATPGPWMDHKEHDLWREVRANHSMIADCLTDSDARFIAEARTGWPYAIRRALEAEAEVDRLRNELNILQEQLEQRGVSRIEK